MKFCQQVILAVALFLATMPNCFAHIIDSESGLNFQYNAKLAETTAPIVDGRFDDPAWEGAVRGKINQEIGKNERWRESSDFAGEFAGVWRNGSLYLAIKITDDSLETHQAKLSRQDRLVIYIDPDHSGHKSDLYSHVLPVGENSPLLKPPLRLVAWSNNGQTCELSFNLGNIPKKGERIGFGIFYYDVDGSRLHHQIAWGPAEYDATDDRLPDLVFIAQLKPVTNQKAVRWGEIKSLY
jgi:hypothetical protein